MCASSRPGTRVRSRDDLPDDFVALFLDPTWTFSCAYFEQDDLTLEQAQLAKIDLVLDKCDLRPGMTVLDIGCGWGSTMLRAIEKYDVNVVGLTLSPNQFRHVDGLLDKLDSPRTGQVKLQDWADFTEPVDRIVCIGTFEHLGRRRYNDFFEHCNSILADDGRMLLQTIVGFGRSMADMGVPVTRDDIEFARFVLNEVFPGGELPLSQWVRAHAEGAGFGVTRTQSLQSHYARTLDCWSFALADNREAAIRIASERVYDRYIKFFTGSAARFRNRRVDIMQFSLVKASDAN